MNQEYPEGFALASPKDLAPEVGTPSPLRAPLGWAGSALIVVAYPVLWCLLRYATQYFTVSAPNISVWFPPAALAYVLLLAFGLRFLPLLALEAVGSYLFFNGDDLPASAFVVYGLANVAVFGTVAALLLRKVRIDPRLPRLSDVLWFVALTSAGALAMGAAQAANAAAHGVMAWGVVPIRTMMYWAGDVSGIVALAPFLLLLLGGIGALWARPSSGSDVFEMGDRRPVLRTAREWLGALGLVVFTAVVAWVVFGVPSQPSLDHSYVLFLPVIWAAVRHGFAYASATVLVLNVGVALVATFTTSRQVLASEIDATALQFALVATTLVGVTLGAFMADRRRRFVQLREAKQRAEAADRLKATLLMNMSHEVRTPLTAILGYADVLREEADEELRPFAAEVRRGGDRLLDTLTLILEQAQIETGLVELEPQRIDVLEVACGVTESFQHRASENGLRLSFEAFAAGGGPPNGWVDLDPKGLHTVLSHLLTNALKFTREGEVRVTCETHPSSVVVRVEDSGVGISADALEHVFEPFHQASRGLNRDFEGVGLGLSIAKHYVDRMGGTITARSEPGEGSCFAVQFEKTVRVGGAERSPSRTVETSRSPGKP